MNEKILIVEDDKKLRALIVDFAKNEQYEIFQASNGIEAIRIMEKNPDIKCLVLDIMMPGLDGWETLEHIRRSNSVPVILLTARNQMEDELKGFKLGANDYVSKPFKPQLLMARIQVQLEKFTQKNEIVNYSGLSIDDMAHDVFVDEQQIELSPKEYELLKYFIENKGIALSREKLLDGVWGMDYFGGLRTVDTHVKRLRVKLGTKSEFVKTIRGLGYKFEVTHNDKI